MKNNIKLTLVIVLLLAMLGASVQLVWAAICWLGHEPKAAAEFCVEAGKTFLSVIKITLIPVFVVVCFVNKK